MENGSRPLWLTTFQCRVALVVLQWNLCELCFFFSQYEPKHNRDWVGQCYSRRRSSYRAHHHRCGGWCSRCNICGQSHRWLPTENGRGYVCFPVDADFCTASDPEVYVIYIYMFYNGTSLNYVQLVILLYTDYTVLSLQCNPSQPVILRYTNYRVLPVLPL